MGKVFPRILLYETVFVNRMPSYIAEAVGNLLTGNEEVGAAQGGGTLWVATGRVRTDMPKYVTPAYPLVS